MTRTGAVNYALWQFHRLLDYTGQADRYDRHAYHLRSVYEGWLHTHLDVHRQTCQFRSCGLFTPIVEPRRKWWQRALWAVIR